MPERGVITNRARARQIRDFSGLQIGTITPTDLDGLIEFHDECFIFCETKFSDAPPLQGQLLALERLCDTCERGGRPTILFITTHNTPVHGDIDMGMTGVVSYRYKFNWHTISPDETLYLKDAVLCFIKQREIHQNEFIRPISSTVVPIETQYTQGPICVRRANNGEVHLAYPGAFYSLCGQKFFNIVDEYKTNADVSCFRCKHESQRLLAAVRFSDEPRA